MIIMSSKALWLLFFAYLLINIMSSSYPLLGFYGFAKILEFTFFGIYITENIKTRNELSNITILLSVTVIAQSLLAMGQYIHQGSLSGIFYFVGERNFSASTPGIANASINGELILRPYGTFPHPNVLAGFLLTVLVLIYAFFDTNKSIIKKALKILSLILGSIALLLTLSRIAVSLWLILTIFFLAITLFNHWKNNSQIFSIISLLIITITIVGFLTYVPLYSRFENTNINELAVTQRVDLFNNALTLIRGNPLFGVGLYNFIPAIFNIQKPLVSILSLQPVHNVFILITAELGIVGLLFSFLFLIKSFYRLISFNNKYSKTLLIILTNLLIIGLFDHYLLTLQQGQLLLSLILALAWSL